MDAIAGLNEKPMTTLNCFKLFEQLCDKKVEQDNGDIEAGIQPRPMSAYMLDFLIQQYGIKSLANKTLA